MEKKYLYLISVVLIVIVIASLFFAGPLSTSRGKFTGVVTKEVILEKGYNLVSVPFTGAKKPVSTDCNIAAIYHYNSDKQDYDDSVASIDDLKPGYGYFIKHRPASTASTTTCKITFMAESGTGISTSNLGEDGDGVLKKGYNMIGGTFEPAKIFDIKGDCNIVAVYGGFDAGSRDYVLVDLATGQLEPTKAYFVKHRPLSTAATTTCALTPDKGGELPVQQSQEPSTSTTSGELSTKPGTEMQVPQAVPPGDSGIESTPVLPV